MQNLELLLKNYAPNFLLIDDFYKNTKIKYLEFNDIVIVTDENLIRNKFINEFLKTLKPRSSKRIIKLQSGEPNYEMIESTSKKIFSSKCELVIAIGGGSILDIAKAACMYENSLEAVDNFSGSRKKYQKKLVKSVAIPTTAGTGSEFTHTSVYKTKQNIKNWLWDELTFFDYVIYIPSFTMNLPKYFTISSGIDAFDHLIESLLSLKFDFKNLELCNAGVEAIWYSLPKLVKNSNDINERKQMMLGSGIAGKAIHYTGCGICHCIAHTLGSLTKVPHGVAVAYGLLHTIEPVLRYNKDLLDRFRGPFVGLSAEELAKKIKDWIKRLEINFEIIENKVDFNKFIEVYYLKDNESMRNNTYYQPSKNDLKILLNKLWK